MAIAHLAAGAGVLAVPALAVTLFLGSGAADPPPTGTTCTVVTTAAADDGAAVPATSTASVQVTGEQAENARVIVAAAKGLGLPEQTAVIGVMTAWQESSLLVLANPTVLGSNSHPHQGSGSDHDSVGLFQQRPSMGWGAVAQLMDPGYASTVFLRALAQVPGWQRMPLWQAAQQVQASADGTAYAQWEPLATALTAALWDSTTGTLSCTGGAGGPGVSGPGGAFAPEACSIRPDPTTGRGCLTPRTLNIATQLMAQGWSVSCWDEHAWNPNSDHPRGRACDAFPGLGGRLPTAAQKARGDALAASLQASAGQTGLSYLIWYGEQWSVSRAEEGWRRYGGGGVYDPRSITGGHYDHIHMSIN
ncbi:MAG: hypothetical protein M3P93_18445 [Actinomycetota bacterium]|nr:hypothetical protein [Actinomycetota bacterium]